QAPLSYQQDPTIRYEPVMLDGSNSFGGLRRVSFPTQRRETRLMIPLDVVVETIDGNGAPMMREPTVTETLTSLGACVPTSLAVEVGRTVRISRPSENVSLFAVIRSRQVAADGI